MKKKIRKLGIFPRNDTADLYEVRENPNSTETGGSRKNPDDGVRHLPDGYSSAADKPIDYCPSGILKAIMVVMVDGKPTSDLESIKENLRRIGTLKIDYKFKVFRSKKKQKIVLVHLITLPEERKTEFRMICNQLGTPVFFLPEMKKKASFTSWLNVN